MTSEQSQASSPTQRTEPAPVVGVVMGSDSDWAVMSEAAQALRDFGVPHEVDVVSAHRMPRGHGRLRPRTAAERGLQVIIAGAGGAAHLPGMLARVTSLPVIGVPVPLQVLDGMDSLLSIVQMPAGVPVATVGIGQARNAGLLAVRILGLSGRAALAGHGRLPGGPARLGDGQGRAAARAGTRGRLIRTPRGRESAAELPTNMRCHRRALRDLGRFEQVARLRRWGGRGAR